LNQYNFPYTTLFRSHNIQLWRVSYPAIEFSQITEDSNYYVDLSVASAADKAVASLETRISDIWIGSSSEPGSLKRITQAISSLRSEEHTSELQSQSN